jgi:hypothetical protein
VYFCSEAAGVWSSCKSQVCCSEDDDFMAEPLKYLGGFVEKMMLFYQSHWNLGCIFAQKMMTGIRAIEISYVTEFAQCNLCCIWSEYDDDDDDDDDDDGCPSPLNLSLYLLRG